MPAWSSKRLGPTRGPAQRAGSPEPNPGRGGGADRRAHTSWGQKQGSCSGEPELTDGDSSGETDPTNMSTSSCRIDRGVLRDLGLAG
jgi:hypothetical protein